MKQLQGHLVATKASDAGLDVQAIKTLMIARGIDVNEISPEIAAERFVRFTASTEDVDGIGDVVKAESWILDEWLTNPAMFVDHEQKVLSMIARGLQAYIDTTTKSLIVDCFFLPSTHDPKGIAEACYKFVRAGIAKGCSIGAVPLSYHYATKQDQSTYGETARRIWDKSLLKELSLVGIGMNSSAKVNYAAKAYADALITDNDLSILEHNDCGEWSTVAKATLHTIHPKKETVEFEGARLDVKAFKQAMLQMEASTKAFNEATAKQNKLNTALQKQLTQVKAENVVHLTTADAESLLTYLAAAAEIIDSVLPKEDEDIEVTEEQAIDVGIESTKDAPNPDAKDVTKSLTAELQRLQAALVN